MTPAPRSKRTSGLSAAPTTANTAPFRDGATAAVSELVSAVVTSMVLSCMRVSDEPLP